MELSGYKVGQAVEIKEAQSWLPAVVTHAYDNYWKRVLVQTEKYSSPTIIRDKNEIRPAPAAAAGAAAASGEQSAATDGGAEAPEGEEPEQPAPAALAVGQKVRIGGPDGMQWLGTVMEVGDVTCTIELYDLAAQTIVVPLAMCATSEA